jgi:hypothetical protein
MASSAEVKQLDLLQIRDKASVLLRAPAATQLLLPSSHHWSKSTRKTAAGQIQQQLARSIRPKSNPTQKLNSKRKADTLLFHPHSGQHHRRRREEEERPRLTSPGTTSYSKEEGGGGR